MENEKWKNGIMQKWTMEKWIMVNGKNEKGGFEKVATAPET